MNRRILTLGLSLALMLTLLTACGTDVRELLPEDAGLKDISASEAALLAKTAEELFPGIKYDYNSSFYASSTDMGDVGTVIPAVHGYTPGGCGTGHGIDYGIASAEDAYIKSSLLSASLAVKLLYGDAEPARKIAANRDGLISIPEYIKTIDKINRTLSSEDL